MISALLRRISSALRSNAGIYLMGTIASRIGAIVLIPLYTRRLDPGEYGEYSLATSGLQLLPMCASLGLVAGLSRVYFAQGDKDVSARAMGAVARGMLVIVVLVLAAVTLALVMFAPDQLFGVRREHWLLVVAAAAGAAAFAVPDLYFRATQSPRKAVALQLTAFFLNAGFGLLYVLALDRRLRGALEAAACAWAGVGVFGVLFVLRLPRSNARNVRIETWKALKVSFPLVPHFIASWLQLTSERWVLAAFGAQASLGTYFLAVQILSPIPMIVSAYNDAEAPRLGELYRDGGSAAAYATLWPTWRRYILVASIPGIALLLGSPLLPVMVGPRFIGAISVLPFLGIGYLLDALYYPASNYLFYAGRTTWIPLVTVTSALLGLGLSLLLLPRFGLAGLVASRVVASLGRSAAMATASWLARPR